MHQFTIDIRVDKRFLETYVIHLVSKYLLRQIAQLHGINGLPLAHPITLSVQAYADVTRLTVDGLADFVAESYPNDVVWTPVYANHRGLTRMHGLAAWRAAHAPSTLELTLVDQDFIARALQLGYGEAPTMTDHDTEYFSMFVAQILPAMEPELRAQFDQWHAEMQAHADANRTVHTRPHVIVDELPFYPDLSKVHNLAFSNPGRFGALDAALRMMDGRITSIDIVGPGRSLLSPGPQSRQQFRNDREAPSRGKKGRTKIFAGKTGGVWPKPGGTRGY